MQNSVLGSDVDETSAFVRRGAARPQGRGGALTEEEMEDCLPGGGFGKYIECGQSVEW